ncbi:hypothetical protein M422DRAFT_268792 [Sphaerobolus stellatus SS14]|uniref:Uncharacterized protein n=1 Tax=Sphaerobolus stellatus (strain SS14) TaxID=990650 RepID=A0A0C9UX38_SPHS4|nr:hypothetical protein M422DRAFT_268792 [Sphaerobolus stellatus SS14]
MRQIQPSQSRSSRERSEEEQKQLVDAQNKEPKTERPRRKRQLPKIVDENLNSQVKTLGQKFTYISLLWLHQPLETFQLPLDEEYDPLDRFESEEGWLQGQLRDLLEAIPAKFHEDMDDERFVNTFTHGMHTQRSNASTRVRRQTGAAIFGCTDEEFTNRGGTFQELIGRTPADNDAEPGSYVAFAPILFKDYTGRFDKWKVFRNPILMRTYTALVLGPSSVKDAKGDEIFVRKESHYNIESLWGIRSITPAAIAASAVLARFSASNDQAFQPIGAVTKIDYQSDFEFYFKYLSEGVRAKNLLWSRSSKIGMKYFTPISQPYQCQYLSQELKRISERLWITYTMKRKKLPRDQRGTRRIEIKNRRW